MNSWYNLSLIEHMANIGAEVQRGIKYKNLGDNEKAKGFILQALKFLEMTVDDPKNKNHRLKEILRVKELIADYFFGDNQYHQTDEQLIKYFQAYEWVLIALRQNKFQKL